MKPSRSELHDLLELWKVKRGDRRMPAWRDFAVPELQRWLGHLNRLQIVDGGADFRFRVYGTKITAAFGVDHAGRLLSSLSPRVADVLRSDYVQAVHGTEPVLAARQRSVCKSFLQAEKLMLP